MPTTDRKLNELVADYIKLNQKDKRSHLSYYVGKDLQEVLHKLLRGGDETRNYDSHQYRVPAEAYGTTQRNLEQVGFAAFPKFKSFDQIFRHVNGCRASGFGRLAVYDAALRIGAMLEIWPDDVYVQQGSEQGAKKLGLPIGKRNIVKYSSLPTPLKRLEPFEVENFLCIFEKLEKSPEKTESNPIITIGMRNLR